MKYLVLNEHVVCVNEVRNAYTRLGDIYIDFKCGTPETVIIHYFNLKSRDKDFLELCKALTELSESK